MLIKTICISVISCPVYPPVSDNYQKNISIAVRLMVIYTLEEVAMPKQIF